jgi:hypothetical protein
MNARKTAQKGMKFSGTGREYSCPKCGGATAECDERRLEKNMSHKFHMSMRTDGALLKSKMAGYVRNTPMGQLMTVMAATPEIRPEKIEQGRRMLQCSDSELEEKLDKAMDCVLEKLLQGE